MDLTLDPAVLSQWIGRTETATDSIDARQARLMQVTLGEEATFAPGDALPPLWHYLYFNPELVPARLKEDGHEKLGRFLPPVALPRRMWAGGRITFHRPLRIGARAVKTSTIRDVTLKHGRSGPLCFVTVEHRVTESDALCLTEVQNIVYREMPGADAAPAPVTPAPAAPDSSRAITPDPVLLFRYSALIFYGHRIHYDADYTRDVEGYPGLVVHGPLIAALATAAGVALDPGRAIGALDIRAHAPLFAPEPFFVEARRGPETQAWARRADGTLAMTVTLHAAPRETPDQREARP